MRLTGQRRCLEPQAPRRAWCGRTTLVCVLLAVITLGVYWPVIFNAFTNYDDTYYVTENAHVQRGLSWGGLVWAFGSLHGEHTYWHPLTWVSHMVDCEVFGLKAWGHHLVNLLLHTLNTVLVFLVFRRMTGAFWRCAVLAGLFALHPLQVDTVAWVAERKNLLSALFWLLTMWAYVRYAEGRRKKEECRMQNVESVERGREEGEGRKQKAEGVGQRAEDSGEWSVVSGLWPPLHPSASFFYVLSLLLFALGLMCKPVLVTLPFVLLLLDYWPLGRNAECGMRNAEPGAGGTVIGRTLPWMKLVWEKLPFFMLAAVSSLITVMAHRGLGMLDAASGPSLGLRMENAVVSYVRYLGSLIWPSNLAVFYPLPLCWPTWKVVVSGVLLLGVSGLVIRTARKRPYLLVGWFWFFGVLVPFIGLVQAGAQAMADRFAYMPLLGCFLLLVWGAHEVASRWRHGPAALSAVAVAAAVLCTALTRRQIGYWKDDESLFRHALAVTENNPLAHLNLGAALNVKGRFDEAIGHFEEAIRLGPGTENAHINLAYALAQKHRLAEAVQQYEAALRLTPGDAAVHNDLGLTLARQGRAEEAITHYTEALRLKAGFAEAHYNLGLTLANQGRYAEAGAHFQEVIRLNPKQANARQKLAQALAAQEKLERATEPYREALRSNPGDARAHSNLGRVLLEAGELEEATEHCAEAARLEPKSAEAQYQLGAALARKGEGEKAAHRFELAVELDPNFAAGHYALGIVCQQQGRMPEALKHWREAARLAPQWADPLNNLAWALATDPQSERRNGQEAVKLASRAVELAGTNHVGVLDTLAAAYAEAGRFAEAMATARQAEAAAVAQGQADLAEQIRQRLTLYGSRQPYRNDRVAK